MEISGLSEAMGQVLLSNQQRLPEIEDLENANREREKRLAAASLRQIRFSEEVQQLRDLDEQVKERLKGVPPAEDTTQLKAQVKEQLERKRELLGQALDANQAYLRLLSELDFAAQERLTTVTTYRDFLAQHLLWTRSAPPFWDPEAFESVPRGLRWLLTPDHWLGAGQGPAQRRQPTPILVHPGAPDLAAVSRPRPQACHPGPGGALAPGPDRQLQAHPGRPGPHGHPRPALALGGGRRGLAPAG
jgi:small-conductance mechanosensitive channel